MDEQISKEQMLRIDKIIITIKFIHSLVFKIKKYKTTEFHTAGKPRK